MDNNFVNFIVHYYCNNSNGMHERALLERYRNIKTNSLVKKNVFIDRLYFIFKVFIFPTKLKYSKKFEKSGVFICDSQYNSQRMDLRNYKLKQLSNSPISPAMQGNRIIFGNFNDFFKIIKIWIVDTIISIYSLFDLNQYQIHGLSQFIYEKNSIILNKSKEVHIFSTYRPEKYLLSAWNEPHLKKFVHLSSIPICSMAFSYFDGVTLVLRETKQIDDLNYNINKGHHVIKDVDIITNGNEFDIYLDKFSKKAKFEIGFFSEGYWMRDKEGYSIEDPLLIKSYIKSNYEEKISNIEGKLLEMCVKFAKKNNYCLAIYLHPCEERMIAKGVKSPYLDYIDDISVFIGEKNHGFSNIYESKIAVVTYPSSSIITDRNTIGRQTITFSYSFLRKIGVKTDKKCEKEPLLGLLTDDINELEETIIKCLIVYGDT